MKYILLFLIRVYWNLPILRQRTCIFKISCSKHVYIVTKQHGGIRGVKEFINRWRQCRPGYVIVTLANDLQMVVLANSTLVQRSDTVL